MKTPSALERRRFNADHVVCSPLLEKQWRSVSITNLLWEPTNSNFAALKFINLFLYNSRVLPEVLERDYLPDIPFTIICGPPLCSPVSKIIFCLCVARVSCSIVQSSISIVALSLYYKPTRPWLPLPRYSCHCRSRANSILGRQLKNPRLKLPRCCRITMIIIIFSSAKRAFTVCIALV